MNTSGDCKVVGGEGSVVRVVGVCGNIDITAPYIHNYRRVIVVSRRRAELNDIAYFKLGKGPLLGKRSDALIADEKIVEVFNARPGRSAVIQRAVKPTESGGKIHDARARVDTLRGEVGTVAAEVVEVVECGVSRKRPAACVFLCKNSVVSFNY